MPQHENKNCPRCGASFECKVGNITECQCSQVQLSHDERLRLEEAYSDCLCASCLVEIVRRAS